MADIYGRTPLHLAAGNGRKEVAQILVESGAEVNVADGDGRTPLHWAAKRGHKEVAQLLIENGADKDMADNEGNTPCQFLRDLSNSRFKLNELLERVQKNCALATGEKDEAC